MKKLILWFYMVLLPTVLLGAGATVSSKDGVSTNLTDKTLLTVTNDAGDGTTISPTLVTAEHVHADLTGSTGFPASSTYTNVLDTLGTCISDASDNGVTVVQGTDNTAALQALLNTATNGYALKLFIHGVYSHTGLVVPGNVELCGIGNAELILRSNANVNILRNAARNTSNTFDTNIYIHDLILNGQTLGQNDNETNTATGGVWLFGNVFSGVRNFRFENMTLRNTKHFGLFVANFRGTMSIKNVFGSQLTQTTSPDVVGLFGPGESYVVENVTGTNITDDVVGIHNDENLGNVLGTNNPVWNTSGPMGPGIVKNTVALNCNSGVRITTMTNRLPDVTVDGVHGTIGAYAVTVTPNVSGFPGNLATITIKNITGLSLAASGNLSGNNNATLEPNACWELINLNSKAENVLLENIQVSSFGDDRPMIYMGSSNHIQNLTINNFQRFDTNSSPTNYQGSIELNTNATVEYMNVNGAQWTKPNLNVFGNFIRANGPGSAISSLSLNSVSVSNNASLVLATNGGYIPSIVLNGIVMHNQGFGFAVQASGTNLAVSSYIGPAVTSGTWLSNAPVIIESGDIFPDYLWLRFNDGSGTTATDSSGNNRNFTLLGAPTWTTTNIIFNGTTQSASNSTLATLNFTSQPFTYDWWINPTNRTGDSVIFANENFNSLGYLIAITTNGVLYLRTDQAGANQQLLSSNLQFTFGGTNWVNLAVTRSGATGVIYVNGVNATSNSVSLVNPVSSTAFPMIAQYDLAAGGSFYAGVMDDLRVYTRALSAAEILQIFNVNKFTHGK